MRTKKNISKRVDVTDALTQDDIETKVNETAKRRYRVKTYFRKAVPIPKLLYQ